MGTEGSEGDPSCPTSPLEQTPLFPSHPLGPQATPRGGSSSQYPGSPRHPRRGPSFPTYVEPITRADGSSGQDLRVGGGRPRASVSNEGSYGGPSGKPTAFMGEYVHMDKMEEMMRMFQEALEVKKTALQVGSCHATAASQPAANLHTHATSSARAIQLLLSADGQPNTQRAKAIETQISLRAAHTTTPQLCRWRSVWNHTASSWLWAGWTIVTCTVAKKRSLTESLADGQPQSMEVSVQNAESQLEMIKSKVGASIPGA